MMSDQGAAFLDTSFIIRYITDDPIDMADRAAAIIDSNARLILSPVIIAETAYVLTSFYRYSRADVVDTLGGLVQRQNIESIGISKDLILQALDLCRGSGRVSFADALLWAEALQQGGRVVYTFDRRFPARGIEIRDA